MVPGGEDRISGDFLHTTFSWQLFFSVMTRYLRKANTVEPRSTQRTLFRVSSDKLWYIVIPALRTVLKKVTTVKLCKSENTEWVDCRTASIVPYVNLLQLQLQKKLNNVLVLLKFPLDFLYRFLQQYDKWLLGFRGLNLLRLKYN